MGMTMLRAVEFDGTVIEYELERKEVKNINLRVRRDGSVHVSANDSVSPEEADDYVNRRGTYVLREVRKAQELSEHRSDAPRYVTGDVIYILGDAKRLRVTVDQREYVTCTGETLKLSVKNPRDLAKKQRLISRYIDRQCREVFARILNEQYSAVRRYGVTMPKLRIRQMESRWGNCEPREGVVTINRRLIHAPEGCIRYVLLHELCHFIHPNHSREYYDVLTRLMPDWREQKELLNTSALVWM